ncbi:MAG: ABC-type oligopeptide transport system, periplasmic component [Verrucomicrobiaceae bacterium]|nr:ABC-type oligopeptide transport system, periplasmic component [Verrucomicrobiaceae bacterium]
MSAVFRILLLCLFFNLSAFAADGVDVAGQRISIALKSEPPTLNSLQASDVVSSFILNHVMEGLLQYNMRNELVAGVAERWQLREDGATFWLRRNALWSDGKPVTARDFVFAWRQVLIPATASRYAFILFPIKNAERVNRGELPADQLGVKAIGDYQIDVQFERPCPYFLGLTAFATYNPLREDFVLARGGSYAADAKDMLFNGPFLLTRWDHGAHLTLQKNKKYWNAAAIRLQEIDIPYITADASAVFNLFQEGSIAMAQLDTATLQEASARGAPMQLFDTGALYFLEFNLQPNRMTANVHLRRAIQAIFAQEQLTDKVIGMPGNLPTFSLFPRSVKGINGNFRDEFPPTPPPRGMAIAKQELALAQSELGIKQWPPLVLLASVSATGKRQAEYFQQLLQTGLNIPVRIDNQIFKLTIEKMNRGDFDIAMAGWLPDFDDAITFGDLLASWNENNRGRYNSPRYDALVNAANATGDQSKRMLYFSEMQKMLIDDVPILPTFESTEIYAINPELHGVSRALFGGDLDFRHAYVEALAK